MDGSPNSREHDIKLFDIPKVNCTREWFEQIDARSIDTFELDDAECQDRWQCLCRAYFSAGAIIGQPHHVCQHCATNPP